MTASAPGLSVIIPAHEEAAYLGACLAALLASDGALPEVEVIVVANGCTDATADIARGAVPAAARRGWRLQVIELARGGKPGALNAGDAAARRGARVYLDADVTVSPPLLAALAAVLETDAPVYASGRPRITARGAAARRYARFWARLPFVAEGVPGFGLFAVNAAGRARWGAFPDIISDDTFARLHFAPSERRGVGARYDWPLIEGIAPLVRVRRRQDRGVAEIARLYPALAAHAAPRPGAGTVLSCALRDPAGFAVYAAVALATRIGRGAPGWVRGR